MEISIVGAIVLLYTIGLIIYCAGSMELFAIKCSEMSIVLCLFFDIGYVLKIGGFELEYNYYFTFLAFVSIIFSRMFEVNDNVKRYLVLMLYIVAVVIIHILLGTEFVSSSYRVEGGWEGTFQRGELDIIHNEIGQLIMPLFRMLIFCWIVSFLAQVGKKDSLERISSTIYYASVIYVAILGIEFILINFIGISYRDIIMSLFGRSSSTATEYRSLIGFKLPLGLSREPSSLAFQSIIIFASNLYYYTLHKKKSIVIVYFVILLTSQSMSSIMYMLGALLLIYYLFAGNNKVIISALIPVVIVIGSVIAYTLFSGRFNLLQNEISEFLNSDFKTFSFNSTIIRMYSVYNNLTYFIRHPFLGTGLYSIYSFSAFLTVLTNFGIFGMGMYLKFYKESILNMTDKMYISGKLVILGLICFLFTGLSGQVLYYPQTFYFFTVSYLILTFRDSDTDYILEVSYKE